MNNDRRRTLRVGLVGAGSMGSLHARVVAGHPDTNLTWIADPDPEHGKRAADRFETTWISTPAYHEVDAVVVAAPTEHHRVLALDAIASGTPLLLEKPLAPAIADSIAIVEAARARGVVLMCGLLERFNPVVRTAFEIAREPLYASTVRHSPYADRIRTGVAGDLLIHDVDLMLGLFGAEPSEVRGFVARFDARSLPGAEDTVEASIGFADGRYATLSASRVSQRKVRSLTITEAERLVEVDLLRQDITVYRHVSLSEFDESAGYRQQTIIDIPVMRHGGEPLRLQLDHFVDLVRGDADAGAELERLLPAHQVVARVLGDPTAL